MVIIRKSVLFLSVSLTTLVAVSSGIIISAHPKSRTKVTPSLISAAILSANRTVEQVSTATAPETTDVASANSSAVVNTQPKPTQAPHPAASAQPASSPNRPVIQPAHYIPIDPPAPTVPYTCYTYNWGDNWSIAYRYDVTPNPDGTKTVVYGGGSGTNTVPTSYPNMCPQNMPPSNTSSTPLPGGSAIYPDQSPH